MGQKPLGERGFEILAKHPDIEVVGVVSNQHAEGTWWKTNGLFRHCTEKNIPFVDNAARNEEEIKKLLQEKEVDFLLSLQHPWILSPFLLQCVGYNALNLHMAKLPDYKGWNGFSHAILNEDTEYGLTLHWISDALDEGSCAYEETVPITQTDTALSLYEKSLEVSLQMFSKMLDDLAVGRVPKYPQQAGGKLYGRDSLEGYKYIPVEQLSAQGNKIIRALYFPPHAPPYTLLNGLKIQLIPGENEQYGH